MTRLSGQQMLMRIFIGESDKDGSEPLYRVIVETLRREGLAGATVLRGVAGFGAHSVYHTDQLLRLSQDLPMLIEAVDTEERIRAVLPLMDDLVGEGLITLEKVEVIVYRREGQGEGTTPP